MYKSLWKATAWEIENLGIAHGKMQFGINLTTIDTAL